MAHYSEEKDLFPMQGGCACGHIRYQIEKPFLLVHCCHCTACQREVGSAFAINAIVESSLVTLLPSAKPTVPASKDIPSAASSLNEVFARLTLATQNAKAASIDGDTKENSTVKKEDKNEAEPNAALAVHKPDLITLPSESTLGVTVATCPKCHVGLWTHYADGGPTTTYLRTGTLDSAWHVDPDVHIFTRSKRSFITLADEKPQFEWYYESRDKFIRPECKQRMEDLKKVAAKYKTELKSALTGH